MLLVAGVAFVLKALIAVAHPGFLLGDDVEIHEMTLGSALHANWPVWELRSAFYPMVFVYPMQRMLMAFGVSDIASLVSGGRIVVALLSSSGLVLVYAMARGTFGRGTSLLAVVVLATSALQVEFGATELPRPISMVFVTAAFFAISRGSGRWRRAEVGGCCIAVAACLRFSEVVFVVPALVHLMIDRRRADGARFAAAFVVTAVCIQAASDYGYWGQPFHSARAIVDFTLVRGLSSRGYDPPWYYVTHLTAWTDWLVAVLAVLATTRHNWRLGLWLWMPILLLSVFPHKEPRYLIPVGAFLSLMAASGFFNLVATLKRIRVRRPSLANTVACAIALAIPLRFIDQISGYHVRRTDAEVGLARSLAAHVDASPVMVEHAWRLGGHLYLGRGRAVHYMDTTEIASSGLARRVGEVKAGLIVVSAATCESNDCGHTLHELGFAEQRSSDASAARYRVFVQDR